MISAQDKQYEVIAILIRFQEMNFHTNIKIL